MNPFYFCPAKSFGIRFYSNSFILALIFELVGRGTLSVVFSRWPAMSVKVMTPLRMTDEVDDLPVNTPVRRTGRVPWPPVMARPLSTTFLPLGTAGPVPDELGVAYSA